MSRVSGVVAGAAGLALTVSAYPQRTVSFPSPDGGTVVADVYGAGVRGVVLAPGGRFRKESWRDQARQLADAGFLAVAIDYRGQGRSTAGPSAAPGDIHLDVVAAVQYLQGTGVESVSLVGGSLGGEAVGRAALHLPTNAVDGIVLLAHSPIGEVEALPGRKLFLTARDDTTGTGRRRLDWIREEYERTPGPKRLVVVEGAAHAQFLFDTPQAPRVMQEILTFLTASTR